MEDWRGSGTSLLVDDEEIVRRVSGRMLERLGFELLTASGGREGIEVFRQHADEIVVVLLDLKMPQMGGEEVLAEIHRIRGEAKVILSSGYDEAEATKRFAGRGLSGFIQKPYRLATLRATLQAALETETDETAN